MKQLSDAAMRQLTHAERARLAIAALIRGDAGEVERLRDTCALVSLKGRPPEYTEAVSQMMAVGIHAECYGRGRIIDLLAASHGSADDPAAAREYLSVAACFLAEADAWRDYCAEQELPSPDLYQAVTGQPSLWLSFADTLRDMVAADPEAKADALAELRKAAALTPSG